VRESTAAFAAAILVALAAAAVGLQSTAQTGERRIRPAGRKRASVPFASAFYAAGRLLNRTRTTPQSHVSASLLATCADLLAACLEAGAIPAAALSASGAGLPDPLGSQVTAAGDALADGAAIEQALPETGGLAPLSAILRRSSRTGSSMSEQFLAVAEQLRADDQFDRLERAQRVGVRSALPLGLCMLPAFLLLAVVPAIAGLSTGILH
jgi:Flp pilus assembly protein TadB